MKGGAASEGCAEAGVASIKTPEQVQNNFVGAGSCAAQETPSKQRPFGIHARQVALALYQTGAPKARGFREARGGFGPHPPGLPHVQCARGEIDVAKKSRPDILVYWTLREGQRDLWSIIRSADVEDTWPTTRVMRARPYEIIFAIAKAAAAARPPISIVCRAPRKGAAPVKRPLK